MTPNARILLPALLGILIVAAPVRATWIEGKVYCDDGDDGFDAGDTPIDGVVVKAVGGTCIASPPNCKDTTGDAVPVSPAVAGYYRIMLPHVDGSYVVMLTGEGVPAGASVLIPADGTCEKTVQVDTGDPSNARKTCNFLLHECPVPTTTTQPPPPTTSTSTSSTSSTSAPTPTTSSTSSTVNPTTSTSSSTVNPTTSTSSTSSSSTSTSTSTTTPTTNPLDICVDTVDHLKCYRTRRTTSFQPNGVSLSDQFEQDVNMTVLRPYRLCNPVDKKGEGIVDPAEHSMCYQIRDTVLQPRFRRREVRVENQFGVQTLVVNRPETLCVPAEKDGVPAPVVGDRMKCYRVVQKFGERDFVETNVTLEDQFETKDTTVIKPVLLCNPVGVDGSEITSPTCHQVCYRITDVAGQDEFVPVPVTVRDEFNDLSVNPFRGECRQVSLLCVPSLKTELD